MGSKISTELNMTTEKKRATIYFDPDLYRTLRLKAASTEISISDLVNEALRQSLREDLADLKAVDERRNEPLISFEDLLKQLHKNGKL